MQTTDQVCPECGAPLQSDRASQAVDSVMHAELAQANVLRLRGERDAAEKKCLSILKRYPNEPEAHSLLGELSADKGDYARAIEWFELALDLNPNSATDRARLDELKNREIQFDTAKTEEQLGLPPQVNYAPWIAGIVILIVLLIAFAAWKSPRKGANSVKGGTVEAPREQSEASRPASNAPSSETAGQSDSGGSKDAPSATPVAFSMEDRTLMQMLQKGAYGGSILSVDEDPRDKALIVTFSAPRAEEARREGATIAKEALDSSPESLLVTVRGISGDQVIYIADGSRPKLAELEGDSNQDFQSGSDAWISSFLQREWPGSNSAATSSNGVGSPGSTTPSGGGTASAPTNGNGANGSTSSSDPGTATSHP